MILIIDNYDSFTYNLYQYLGELGCEMCIERNDGNIEKCIEENNPSHIVISPGPGHPKDAGKTIDTIRKYGNKIPVLGVCLGHQAIAQAFGGRIAGSEQIFHGKQSTIYHDGRFIFKGLPQCIKGGRYHSLIVDRNHFPQELIVSAWTQNDEIMSIRHIKFPVFGIQFHPESILTKYGKEILKNFLVLGVDINDKGSNFQVG